MRISDWSSDVCSSDLPGSAASSQLIEKGEPAEIDAEGRHRIEADPEHRPVAPFQQARQVDRRQRDAQKRGEGREPPDLVEDRTAGIDCVEAEYENQDEQNSDENVRKGQGVVPELGRASRRERV